MYLYTLARAGASRGRAANDILPSMKETPGIAGETDRTALATGASYPEYPEPLPVVSQAFTGWTT